MKKDPFIPFEFTTHDSYQKQEVFNPFDRENVDSSIILINQQFQDKNYGVFEKKSFNFHNKVNQLMKLKAKEIEKKNGKYVKNFL